MLDYLLPIGSVVTLEEGKHKLMIFGVKQTHSETGKLYDYACSLPGRKCWYGVSDAI